MLVGMPVLFEYYNLEDNFILAKSLNLDFVELNLNFSYVRTALENHELKPLLDKYQLKATLHFIDEGDFGSYPLLTDAFISMFKQYSDLTKDLIINFNIHLQRGPVMTISGIPHCIYEKEYNEYLPRLINNLHIINDICQDNHQNLTIENVDDLAPYMLNVYEKLIQEDFNLCLDIGHDYLTGNQLLNFAINNHLKFKEYHFHDANNSCHYALGDGILDLKKYLKMAKDNKAEVVIEVKSSEDLIKSIPVFNQLKNNC